MVSGVGSGVIQETKTGIGVGAIVGGTVGGLVGLLGGPAVAAVGATVGAAVGGYIGSVVTGDGTRQLENSYPTPDYRSSEGRKTFVLKKGTPLFHGTRWVKNTQKWWENSMPNKTGEDGGISFALDPNQTPKIRNAQIILEYRLKKDVTVTGCRSKGDFYEILSQDSQAVCYAVHETELVIHPSNLSKCIEFVYAHESQKTLEQIV